MVAEDEAVDARPDEWLTLPTASSNNWNERVFGLLEERQGHGGGEG